MAAVGNLKRLLQVPDGQRHGTRHDRGRWPGHRGGHRRGHRPGDRANSRADSATDPGCTTGGDPTAHPGSASAPAVPPPAAAVASDPTTVSTLALLSPAQAAELLGVGEADVIASLEAGDLKGKKIGSVYRIPRKAIDDFLNG